MSYKQEPVKIGTRGSKLALWQAREVGNRIEADTNIVVIKTSGDRFQNIPLQGQKEKGFFTKEIEDQLVSGKIDMAVHSLKDLPTLSHPELVIAAYLTRTSVTDVLLIRPEWHSESSLLPLRDGCIVGATSLRRQALLKHYHPAVKPTILRGNVPTRIRKCTDGLYGAIILARAGIERLKPDMGDLIVYELNPGIWLPAPGQGAIAVQIRERNQDLASLLKKINNPLTEKAVKIERQILGNFGGGCHTAFASYAQLNGNQWKLYIGIENGEDGWLQLTTNTSFESAQKIDSTSIAHFKSPSAIKREELCLKIQLSS